MIFQAAVMTVSDRSYRGARPDAAGPEVRAVLERAGYQMLASVLVPDEREIIAGELCRLADAEGAALIVTTGGTGFAPRDVTPEATLSVCERMAPGLAEAIVRQRAGEVIGKGAYIGAGRAKQVLAANQTNGTLTKARCCILAGFIDYIQVQGSLQQSRACCKKGNGLMKK